MTPLKEADGLVRADLKLFLDYSLSLIPSHRMQPQIFDDAKWIQHVDKVVKLANHKRLD